MKHGSDCPSDCRCRRRRQQRPARDRRHPPYRDRQHTGYSDRDRRDREQK